MYKKILWIFGICTICTLMALTVQLQWLRVQWETFVEAAVPKHMHANRSRFPSTFAPDSLIEMTKSILNKSDDISSMVTLHEMSSMHEATTRNHVISSVKSMTKSILNKSDDTSSMVTLHEMSSMHEATTRNHMISSVKSVSMEEIKAERFEHLRKTCKEIGREMKPGKITSKIWEHLPVDQRPRLYFSDKYKLIFCAVPKCGSTEWRKALLILENDVNTTSPDEIDHQYAFTRARERRSIWTRFPKRTNRLGSNHFRHEIDRRLNTYTRFITVREPLERLVSAYIDKLLPGGSGGDVYAPISYNIHKKFGNGTGGPKTRATFDEFVSHVLSAKQSNKLDIHWRPYSDICDPCSMKYQDISKLETIVKDSSYIADKFGIDNHLLFPGPDKDGDLQHKWKTKYARYFEELTRDKVKKVFDFYEKEYRLFGYSPPNFMI